MKLQLQLDRQSGLPILPVALTYNGKSIYRLAVVDTGSTSSSITLETAKLLDIDLELTNRGKIVGVSGIKETPVISEIGVIILEVGKIINLKEIHILDDVKITHPEKRSGIKIGERIEQATIPNLLGLDFLKESGAKLVISFKQQEFYIEL